VFHLDIVAVGRQKEPWMRQGMAEYAKRLSAYCDFRVVEVEEYRLPEDPSPAQIQKGLEEEGRVILEKLGKTPYAALCIEGKEMSSPGLAAWLEERRQLAGSLAFVIGGSFGLSREVKEKAALRLSVSPMTFPHQLFRVMLAEQLYRAFSISAGGKYHK
jgi:23S rRNA (pseudouridine1915-N3)-methyltransferase